MINIPLAYRNGPPTERAMIGTLLWWTLDLKGHILSIPNITVAYSWECDLLSITPAHFAHEFEIKISRADYAADFRNKPRKHLLLRANSITNMPNYYWFVTSFQIDPPEYAGWIRIEENSFHLEKKAPRRHSRKVPQHTLSTIGRLACYRLKGMYAKLYSSMTDQPGALEAPWQW